MVESKTKLLQRHGMPPAHTNQLGQMSRPLLILLQTSDIAPTIRNCEDGLTIFLDPAKNVVHIVREKSFGVEHGLNETSDGTQWHVFVVSMTIPLGML